MLLGTRQSHGGSDSDRDRDARALWHDLTATLILPSAPGAGESRSGNNSFLQGSTTTRDSDSDNTPSAERPAYTASRPVWASARSTAGTEILAENKDAAHHPTAGSGGGTVPPK